MQRTEIYLFFNRSGELITTEFCRDWEEARVAKHFFNMACEECYNEVLMISDVYLLRPNMRPVPGKERGWWIEG